MNKGKVELEAEFTVCREGEILGSGQATLLKAFGVATSEFRIIPVAVWQKEQDTFTICDKDDDVQRMEINEELLEMES